MSFKKEPVLYVAALLAVLNLVKAYLSKDFASIGTLAEELSIALGALVVRRVVTPSFKVPGSAEDHDGVGDGEEVDADFWDDENANR